ncbi:DUF3515 domain-containing protein [Nocardioides cavernae]|uniref:DUF3515 domain-containing protein n=1 Tax=Nocardioides cavernae TaxID=1921566 RepID=A0ABR8NHU2_9ACTN|nr:DUF3515 domain-containing protein [Nocardioides cavernae]MBD3926841.1 DUF3515 domain-containing protein [Nocardioides cavernae]MBM7512563.1 hypothetical protein [Nocardioides cavernae]
MQLSRRLGPSTGRGVVASGAAAVVLALAGCSSTPTIDDVELSAADRAACESLVADLPDTLAGLDRRDVEPADALGAAWGDPAYVLTCGVAEPGDYEPTAECNVIDGVGWYVTDDQLSDQGEDATPIALSLRPYVEVSVPADYRTEGIDRALAELAPALKEHLGEGLSCL